MELLCYHKAYSKFPQGPRPNTQKEANLGWNWKRALLSSIWDSPPQPRSLSHAVISDLYQHSAWPQLVALISTLPPPRMRNISLNLSFSHRRKYQEVSETTAARPDNRPARRILQHWRNNWLSERACFEVTTCSTHSTRAGLDCTGLLSWQALFVPVEEFLCEERMRMHLGNDLILQKMLLVAVHPAERFSFEGNVAEPLCRSPW